MKKINSLLLATALCCTFPLASHQNSPLFQEARAGNTEAIKERIKNCENCAEKDENGNTPLHIAAQEGHVDLVDLLTTTPEPPSGWYDWFWGNKPTLPDKDEKNKDDNTPLHCALQAGKTETAECLIDKKADTRVVNKEKLIPGFMIVKQGHANAVPFLVQKNLIAQTINGDTMLHYAIKTNKPEMVEKLAEISSLVNAQDSTGKTPAIIAAETNDAAMLKILKGKGVNLTTLGGKGFGPIHNAAYKGNLPALRFLLENNISADTADNNGYTPLLQAAAGDQQEIIDFLLSHNADVKKCDNKGQNIFIVATCYSRHNLVKRLKNDPAFNIDIDARDNSGKTAFMYAVNGKDHPMMNILISLGANIRITDNSRENALHRAAKNGDFTGCEILLKNNKIFLNDGNMQGETPLFSAVQNGYLSLVKLFITHDASLKIINNNHETILHKAAKNKNLFVLIELLNNPNRPHLEAKDCDELTALHYAAEQNNYQAMDELVKHGACYTQLARHGNTLAHTAALHGNVAAINRCKQYDPQMIFRRNTYNDTPFLLAVNEGQIESATCLLHDNDFTSDDFTKAVNIARARQDHAIFNFLQKEHTEREKACAKITSLYTTVDNLKRNNVHSNNLLLQKDLLTTLFIGYKPTSPDYYSEKQLYKMPEVKRKEIYNNYIACHTYELTTQNSFTQKFNAINHAQEQEREAQLAAQKERVREQEEKQRQERIRIEQQNRRIIEAQEAELERIKQHNEAEIRQKQDALKQKEERLARELKQQQDALNEITAQKKETDFYAAQKKELEFYAAQKALADQQKHNQALEGQHPRTHAQTSAPAMGPQQVKPAVQQEKVHNTCHSCSGALSVKPLPCNKCKKKSADTCNNCLKKQNGKCTACNTPQLAAVAIEQGECCIGAAGCKEEHGVAAVPCNDCKIGSARICSSCLEGCIKIKPGFCPTCGKKNLNEELIKKILKQQ